MEADNNSVNKQIYQCLELLKNVFKEDLLGVYLYGSSLLGGLQKFSDIDLFAILNRETTHKEKEQLEKALLGISGIYAQSKELKPIELTIVVKSDINPWHYPPKFDFLYGDWMRKDFEAGKIEPWPTKIQPNLALIITQMLLSYKTLFGSNPNQLLDPVPYGDFLNATTAEINSLINDIDWDTRNVLLTLARIWSTLETDTIRSKSDAAEWTITKLPAKYKQIMERALLICLGREDEHWEDISSFMRPCADFMLAKIKERSSLIESSNYHGKIIKLA